jgi:hypothetical protein
MLSAEGTPFDSYMREINGLESLDILLLQLSGEQKMTNGMCVDCIESISSKSMKRRLYVSQLIRETTPQMSLACCRVFVPLSLCIRRLERPLAVRDTSIITTGLDPSFWQELHQACTLNPPRLPQSLRASRRPDCPSSANIKPSRYGALSLRLVQKSARESGLDRSSCSHGKEQAAWLAPRVLSAPLFAGYLILI